MAIRSAARIAVSVAVSVTVVGAVGPTAGARIPEADWGTHAPAYQAVAAVPDVFERAVQRSQYKPQAVVVVPDAFERAVQRRNREVAAVPTRAALDR